mgnify:FL=1
MPPGHKEEAAVSTPLSLIDEITSRGLLIDPAMAEPRCHVAAVAEDLVLAWTECLIEIREVRGLGGSPMVVSQILPNPTEQTVLALCQAALDLGHLHHRVNFSNQRDLRGGKPGPIGKLAYAWPVDRSIDIASEGHVERARKPE